MGKRKFNIASLTDKLQGDKVIWTILFLLIGASILAISSSTSQMVKAEVSRMDLAMNQMIISGICLGVVIALYSINKVGVFWYFARFGFIFSFAMLAFVALRIDKLPIIKASPINGAWRCITVTGIGQLHIYEFVKIFMILYIAWAMDAIRNGTTSLADSLSRFSWQWKETTREPLKFLGTESGKTWFYVIIPILVTTALIANGGVSSALIIGTMMVLTALIAGLNWKHLVLLGVLGVITGVAVVGVYFVSDGKYFNRIGTAISRITQVSEDPLAEMRRLKPGTVAFQNIVDDNLQEISAKIAISEGGLLGKGPGKSTQRYVVPVMYEDYMYSFIVEEYGLIGGIFIMLLYGSLLARGAMLARCCDDRFYRTVVAGITLLISGQALIHIMINADVMIHTGQTLPIISHGKSSFLAFSIAFGILLSISKVAKKKMEKLARERAEAEAAAANIGASGAPTTETTGNIGTAGSTIEATDGNTRTGAATYNNTVTADSEEIEDIDKTEI